ncbi:MAG TPA: helix-turn-helix transcriptional regulator [Afifellaceae bacterium]|nr:helix-turn-helix transcriptional regulator [Afifellaceae bacterium]
MSKANEHPTTMTPAQFRSWRKSLSLKQKEAADRLGLKKRMIQYYETGKRDGKHVAIPKAVSLACYALTQGVKSFDGSETIFEDGFGGRKSSDKDDDADRAASRPNGAA